jgi:hypothetical protein
MVWDGLSSKGGAAWTECGVRAGSVSDGVVD